MDCVAVGSMVAAVRGGMAAGRSMGGDGGHGSMVRSWVMARKSLVSGKFEK